MSTIKGDLIMHQNEDGSKQLRDDISRFWCACGNPAVHYRPNDMPQYEFLCIECNAKDVQVYRLCECDAVAAYSLEDALEWYKELTGIEDDELYSVDEMEIMPMDREIHDGELTGELITVQEIINRYWEGEPFIAVSTEW